MKKVLALVAAASVALIMLAGSAMSDWNPGDGHKMHYPQLPDSVGWDVAWQNINMQPIFLGDDWKCSATGPVEDIHFWFSSFNDEFEPGSIFSLDVSIWSNLPADTPGCSIPDTMLWQQRFFPPFKWREYGQGDQGWYIPGDDWWPNNHKRIFQINLTNIDDPFVQEEGEIYWLVIQLKLPVGVAFSYGWKTSGARQFMDDAVWAYPHPDPDSLRWNELKHPLTGRSLDLAFVITGPEEELDFGDLKGKPTFRAENGPRHATSHLWLGQWFDLEPDSRGYENDNFDDGVKLLGSRSGVNPFSKPYKAWDAEGAIEVFVNGDGTIDTAYVSAWFDQNHDCDFGDTLETIVCDAVVSVPGNYTFIFPINPSMPPGDAPFRVRLSPYPICLNPGWVGYVQDGEVEDSLYVEGQIPVELTSFNATSVNGVVTLEWKTQSETENHGYHIYRNMVRDGEYSQITKELIKGTGSSDEAQTYSYIDSDVEAGKTYYYKLADVDFNGNTNFHGPISVTVEAQPMKYALSQNYPNPFNPETAINFALKEAGKVILKIYNLQGQLVRTLVDEERLAGNYSVMWNGTNDNGNRLVSGVYYYTLTVNGFSDTKKLVFMK